MSNPVQSQLTNSPKEAGFWAYHKASPTTWVLFEEYALRAVGRGHNRLSGWFIINRIRWEEEVEGGKHFKVSNNHIAFYTRLFLREYPQHKRFFKIKKMIGD